MSHGGGEGEASTETALIPLLDLVLQLVMFFMMVANFVSEQFSTEIALPTANQARPLSAEQMNTMFANIDKKGYVVVSGYEPKLTEVEIETIFKTAASTHPKGAEWAKENVILILRSDRDTEYRHLFKTMSAGKKAGFRQLQLRALLKS
ncbi:MAG: biopolymer transporter ExbD [Zavarzinella sp.]